MLNIKSSLVIFFIGLCTLLRAQVYGADQENHLWWKGLLVRDKGSSLVVEGLKKIDCKTIEKDPFYDKTYDIFNDIFWTVKKRDSENGQSRLEIYSSIDANKWDLEGYLSISKDVRPIHIWPVQNNTFLGMFAWDIELDGKSSPFALLKYNNSNELKIDSLLQPGFKGRLRWKNKEDDKWYFAPENMLLSLIWGREFVRTPTALVIYNTMTGYFWSIDTSKESPELKFGMLFPKLSGDFIGSNSEFIQPPLLTVLPRQDGHVVITSRSELAVFESRKDEKSFQFQGPPDPQAPKVPDHVQLTKAQIEEEALRAFPDLLWWDLDPTTMNFKSIDTPNGFANKFYSLDELRHFTFRFTPEGNITK